MAGCGQKRLPPGDRWPPGRVIDLPGSGTSAAELGEWQADIAAVRRISDRIGTETVLVGHSRGGIALTEFADTGQCSTAYA